MTWDNPWCPYGKLPSIHLGTEVVELLHGMRTSEGVGDRRSDRRVPTLEDRSQNCGWERRLREPKELVQQFNDFRVGARSTQELNELLKLG